MNPDLMTETTALQLLITIADGERRVERSGGGKTEASGSLGRIELEMGGSRLEVKGVQRHSQCDFRYGINGLTALVAAALAADPIAATSLSSAASAVIGLRRIFLTATRAL